MTNDLSKFIALRFTGDEAIVGSDARLLDFWQWAGSNLMGNVNRGVFAEYLVALDLGIACGTREEWAPCDLVMPDGTRIEVKTSAYLQDWKQNALSI